MKGENDMKKIILTVLIITMAGFFPGHIPECFAGASPAAGDDCCVVENPGNGALALKGTIAIEYTWKTAAGVFVGDLDVLLRLSKGQGGDVKFFRLNLLGEDLEPLYDPSIICLVLNPGESDIAENRAKVKELVNEVLKAFFGSDTDLNADNTRLVITYDSISDAQGVFGCDEPEQDPNDQIRDTKLCEIPGTEPPRIFSMATVTIYVVDPTRANFVEPSCKYPPPQ